MRESPCKACPIFSGADLSAVPCDDPCSFLSRYLGQQEGAKERDALRAEVEMLRRAMQVLAELIDCGCCPMNRDCEVRFSECDHSRKVQWAISEAAPDKEGEG